MRRQGMWPSAAGSASCGDSSAVLHSPPPPGTWGWEERPQHTSRGAPAAQPGPPPQRVRPLVLGAAPEGSPGLGRTAGLRRRLCHSFWGAVASACPSAASDFSRDPGRVPQQNCPRTYAHKGLRRRSHLSEQPVFPSPPLLSQRMALDPTAPMRTARPERGPQARHQEPSPRMGEKDGVSVWGLRPPSQSQSLIPQASKLRYGELASRLERPLAG